MKNVLILSGSPRRGGNSDILCDEFARGAAERGNHVEKIRVSDKKIGYCRACYYCRDNGGACVLKDDMTEVLQKMIDADVIVLASPVYFYSIDAPQLSDWGNSSAEQTIALTEYLLDAYAIDRGKVYINGYSGGGETLSLVLTKRPELFTAALHVASVWDGELAPLVQARTPVYFVIGESDEYYGSARISRTYEELCRLYRAEGLTEEEIGALAVLDVKDRAWFGGGNQHGGIGRVSQDETVMRWLFGR